MKRIEIVKEFGLDYLIELILEDAEAKDILDCLDLDDIEDYLDDKGYDVVDSDEDGKIDETQPLTRYQISRIVKQRTNLYPDKETVKKVFSDIIDELW